MKNILKLLVLSCFLGITLYSQNNIDVVKKVADKIINETSFELYQKAQQKGSGLQIVNLPGEVNGKIIYAQSLIVSGRETEAEFGISATVPVDIWINGRKVFSSSLSLGDFETAAYDMYEFPERFNGKLDEGENYILIKTLTGSNDFFALVSLNENGMINENITFELPLNDKEQNSFHKWVFLGPVNKTDIGNIEPLLTNSQKIKQHYSINGTFYSRYIPSTNIILDDVIKDDYSFTKHSYFEWHYANGQMMLGMLALADITNDQQYLNYIKKFCGFTLDTFDYFKYQYDVLNERTGFNHRLFRRKMLDDTGAPALPFIELYSRKELSNAKFIIDTIAVYVSEKQPRLADGTLCRPEPRKWTVWADDLFMSVPYLLRYAKLTGEEQYYDDAANQIILFFNKLFDPGLNLYYHGWFSDTKENSAAHWGRANGWIMWAVTEALLYLPEDHPKYDEIMEIYKKHIKGLVEYQSASGLWHQVIDKPESYLETSSSAMFTLGIARGVLNGWLDKSYKEKAVKGWNGLKQKIDENGTVYGICRGTGIGFDLNFYYSRQTPPNDPRGLGAVLTAGAEISKLLNESGK